MKNVINILLFISLFIPAVGQEANLADSQTEQKSEEIKIYFGHNSHVVDLNFEQNQESLSHFADLVETLNNDPKSTISKIEINSYTSPEGGYRYNKKLSERRTNAIYNYLIKTLAVPDSLISKSCSGIDWKRLQEIVKESNMQYRDEVLYILKNVPEETWRKEKPSDKWLTLVDSRNKHLMDLEYGRPYRYMFKNIYPQLRNGSVVTIYFARKADPIISKNEEIEAETTAEAMPMQALSQRRAATEAITTTAAIAAATTKPLLALKTNLLYDAITAVNIEIEVPIKERWSVAGEWIFPWWTSCGNKCNKWQKDSNRNTFQLLQGNIEGKYWFGDRTERPVMTGWYAGLYAGGGEYDFERNAEGYQGEFFIAAGLSGGYAHTINKSGNLRMEYSLGVGYLKTNYRHYKEHYGINDQWHTIRQASGKQSWLGPTKAKISLVWMLNRKVNKEK